MDSRPVEVDKTTGRDGTVLMVGGDDLNATPLTTAELYHPTES